MSRAYDATRYVRDEKGEWIEDPDCLTEVETHDPEVLREKLREGKRKGVFTRIVNSDDTHMIGYYSRDEKIEYVSLDADEDDE